MSGRTRVLILLALLIVGVALAVVFILPSLQQQSTPTTTTANQPTTGQQRPTNTPAVTNTPIATPFPTQELTEIVVAVQSITRGSVIPPTALELRPWPVEALPYNHFKNIEDVAGGIARTDIYVEQPILTSLVVRSLQDLADVGSDVAAIIPPGRRLVTLKMDRFSSNAYAIQPGDYVDVIAAFVFGDVDEEFQTFLPNNVFLLQPSSEEDLTFSIGDRVTGRFDTRRIPRPVRDTDISGLATIRTVQVDWPVIIQPSVREVDQVLPVVTHITVQDALVMGIGLFPMDGVLFKPLPTPTPVPTQGPATAANQQQRNQAPEPTKEPERPDLITLAVTPQEAVILTHMQAMLIPYTFSLRSAADRSRPSTDPVSTQYILDLYGVTRPPRANVNLRITTNTIRILTYSLGLSDFRAVPEGAK